VIDLQQNCSPAEAGAHHLRCDPLVNVRVVTRPLVMDPRLRGGTDLFWGLMLAIAIMASALTATTATAQNRLPPAPLAYKQLDDPAQEAKAKALMDELRCLVCQGQSIADSDAPLAGDMRHEVRSKIAAGESPDAIREWLIARYGNWVTYNPPLDAATALLWVGPILFLLAGLWLARGRFSAVRRDPEDGA
jgi:cytochrome c-type biogenesis protein CcmH